MSHFHKDTTENHDRDLRDKKMKANKNIMEHIKTQDGKMEKNKNEDKAMKRKWKIPRKMKMIR